MKKRTKKNLKKKEIIFILISLLVAIIILTTVYFYFEFQPEEVTEESVLYLGMMVHLESWDEETIDEDLFNRHVEVIRTMADVFEKYDAKLTFESREQLSQGIINWEDNILQELYDRGHGIGAHADLGGTPIEQGKFIQLLTTRKREMDNLLTTDVRHVSGICSENDWVEATIEAGYEFTTGGVAYCVMSMPEELRPEEYKNCANPGECHDAFPSEIEDRIHPWRISSGLNWIEEDPDGELVFFPSSSVLYNLYEDSLGTATYGTNAEFTEEDLDEFFIRLDKALTYVDSEQFNMMYFSWSIGSRERVNNNIDLFEQWFERLQHYIDSGQVEWQTIPGMYDLYLDWEGRQ
ncbi:MAG: hypothetical protein ABIF40_04735 [archaeon]